MPALTRNDRQFLLPHNPPSSCVSEISVRVVFLSVPLRYFEITAILSHCYQKFVV